MQRTVIKPRETKVSSFNALSPPLPLCPTGLIGTRYYLYVSRFAISWPLAIASYLIFFFG